MQISAELDNILTSKNFVEFAVYWDKDWLEDLLWDDLDDILFCLVLETGRFVFWNVSLICRYLIFIIYILSNNGDAVHQDITTYSSSPMQVLCFSSDNL